MKTAPLVWTSTATLLPDPGALVLFTLRGSRIPRAGYYDTVSTYLDRTKSGEEEKEFALDRWWTSALDEDDYWEVTSVAYWCEFLDVPPLNVEPAAEARAEALALLRIAAGVEAPVPFPPRCAKVALEIFSEHEQFKKDLVDLNEVLTDKRRLTRELDVKLNGLGAAKTPGLADILGQFADTCPCGTFLLRGWKRCPRCSREIF